MNPINFGNWQPDRPSYDNDGTSNVRNVLPRGRGYGPFKDFVSFSNALTARCQGAISTKDKSGNIRIFAGDATKLYRQTGATFSDVSRLAGGAYAVGATDFWDFTLYNDNLVAVNIADDPQVFALATDSNFSALSGSPPKAKHCATVREFAVLGNLVGFPNRLHWCGSGNLTNWTVGSGESDRQDIYEGGPINRIIGGEYGVIFQDHGITRMSRVGGSLIFQLDKVETNRGTLYGRSVIPVGANIYYLDHEGFMVFDGQQSRPIGAEAYDKTIVDQINAFYPGRIIGAVDPKNHFVCWIFVSNSASLVGIPDKMLVYNYVTNRASIIHINLEYILSLFTTGTDLDTMGATYPDLDALTISLDSPIWAGGSLLFGGFNSDHKEGFFTGDNLQAILETAEMQNSLQRMVLRNIIPLIDTASVTAAAGYRERLADSVQYTDEAAMEIDGTCPVLASARYMSYRLTVAAGATWTHGVGVIPDLGNGGYS